MPFLALLVSLFVATIGFDGRTVEPKNEKPPTTEDTPEYIIVDMNTP